MKNNKLGRNCGENNPMYGKKHSKETKIKIGLKSKGRKHTEKTKYIISKKLKGKNNPMYGKTHSKKAKIKISKTHKGKKIPNWQRKLISEANKNKIMSKKTRNLISIGNKGKPKTKEHKKKLSIAQNKLWQKESYRTNQLRKIVSGHLLEPTCLEKQMIKIIEKYNLPFRYTGNGERWICRANPDFISTDGKKICIEVANTFHHSEDYPKKRIAYFKKYGWKCYVFMTNKLNEKEILDQIQDDY